MRKYSRFVVLTEEDREYWGDTGNIRVIPNPVTFHPTAPAPLDTKTVVAVGRYSHQKGLERLISAWGMVPKNDWKLRLVGDGENREQLERQIDAFGLQESVRLGREESDMASVYDGASIVALSSRYEGLPMVLLEALARAGMSPSGTSSPVSPSFTISRGPHLQVKETAGIPWASASSSTIGNPS